MTFHYRVTGEARKALVYAIAELLNCKPHYLRAPSYAFQVSDYNISKDGDVTFADTLDKDSVDALVSDLKERGFTMEEEEQTDFGVEITGLTVSLPLDGFDVASLNRLHALVASKRTLLQKALGVESLPVQVTEDKVSFPWFHGELDADHFEAYNNLISRICDMAKNGKRVTAKDKETGNDKYAFRCFLLRLGFIGDDFKRQRKVLLERLDGSSAFRNGTPKVKESEVQA